MCPFPLWLSRLDFEGPLKLLTQNPGSPVEGRTRAGLLPQRAHQHCSRKLKAGLQEHPNTSSATCNRETSHCPEQAVLWHRNRLNWVSQHMSSGDQLSGTCHPTTAGPAPEHRPRSTCHTGAKQHGGRVTMGLHTAGQAQTPSHKKSRTRDFPRAETPQNLHEFRLQRCWTHRGAADNDIGAHLCTTSALHADPTRAPPCNRTNQLTSLSCHPRALRICQRKRWRLSGCLARRGLG